MARTKQFKPLALRVNDLLFLNEYFRNGRNGTQAYKTVHPKASLTTSAVQANTILKKPKIAEEIQLRLRVGNGVTREFVESHLLHALELAKDQPAVLTTVCRELAELAGLKIQKVADVSERSSTLPVPERTSRISHLLTRADDVSVSS